MNKMYKSDVVKNMAILEVSYPNWVAKLDKDKMKVMVDLWAELFAEDDPEVISRAIKAIIQTDTNSFPPNIAQIRAKAYELTHPSELTEMEAWTIIMNALRNSGRNSKEEYAKLPPVLQLVTSPQMLHEWSQMDIEQVQTVISSNFMRSYRVRAHCVKSNELLPNSMKGLICEFKDQFRTEVQDKGVIIQPENNASLEECEEKEHTDIEGI